MSYVASIRLLVEDLKAMKPAGKPSGASRLASAMDVPRQTIYAWSGSVSRERRAKEILLNVEQTSTAAGDQDILDAVRQRLKQGAHQPGEA